MGNSSEKYRNERKKIREINVVNAGFFCLSHNFCQKKPQTRTVRNLMQQFHRKNCTKQAHQRIVGSQKVEIYPKTFLSFVNEN